jgi:hypothetical protein
MQPNELLIRQHFIVIKSRCYSAADKARVDMATVDKAITDGRATKEATAKKTTVAGAQINPSWNQWAPTPLLPWWWDPGGLPQQATPPLLRSGSGVLGSSGMGSYSDACFSFPFHLSYA